MNKRNLDKLTFYKFTQFFTDRDIVKICVSLLIDEEDVYKRQVHKH